MKICTDVYNIVLGALERSRNSHTYETQTAAQRMHRADLLGDIGAFKLRAESFSRLEKECLDAIDILKAEVKDQL